MQRVSSGRRRSRRRGGGRASRSRRCSGRSGGAHRVFGRPNVNTALRKARSRGLWVGAPIRLARAAEPGPCWSMRSRSVDELQDERLARRALSSCSGRVAARSRRVRMGVVTGRPWLRVVSSVRGLVEDEAPAVARGPLRGRDLDERRHRGEEGQDVGGGPVAQRRAGAGDEQPGDEPPAVGIASCPTAYTPRCTWRSRPIRGGVPSPSPRCRARPAARDRRPRPGGSRAAAITSSTERCRTLTVTLTVNVHIARIHGAILTPADRAGALARRNRHTSGADPQHPDPSLDARRTQT